MSSLVITLQRCLDSFQPMSRPCCVITRNYVVKRKYPLNPDCGLEDTPIFQYGVGDSTDRRMYVWGLVEHGALGIQNKLQKGREPPEYYQRPSCHSFSFIRKINDIACGFGFTAVAVKSNDKHKLFGCGINSDSQIGYHAPRRDHPLSLVTAFAPIDLPTKSDRTKLLKVAAGRAHLVALSDNEGAFTLGNNAYGQCGRFIIEDENYEGSQIVHNIRQLGEERIVDICCGHDHTFFITESGKVWSCGWGADGQTGTGHYNNQPQPTLVKGDIQNEKIVKITGFGDCVLALSDKGEVFGWGNNEYKQLLQKSENCQFSSPVVLKELLQFGRIVDIAAGGSSCTAVNENGVVYVWGYGLLGAGPKVANSSKPIELPSTLFGRNQFNTNTKVVKVVSGLYHLGAITNEGHLYMWGRNKGACLGLGHKNDQYFPFKVAVGAYVVKVATGVDHTVALCKPFA